MSKQYVVIGGGRFGQSVAIKLAELGAEVMVVDRREEAIQQISDHVTYAVQADATDESAIKSLGIRNFDVAIVTIGSNIQASILVALMVKELGVKQVIAKAQSSQHAKILYKIGVDRVVFPEKEMGIKVANSLFAPCLMDLIDLSPSYSILEIAVQKNWVGKTLLDLDIRQNYGISIIAVKREDMVEINVEPNYTLLKSDILVVVGHIKDLKNLDESKD